MQSCSKCEMALIDSSMTRSAAARWRKNSSTGRLQKFRSRCADNFPKAMDREGDNAAVGSIPRSAINSHSRTSDTERALIGSTNQNVHFNSRSMMK